MHGLHRWDNPPCGIIPLDRTALAVLSFAMPTTTPKTVSSNAALELFAEYVKPDSKGRVALGTAVPDGARYHVYRNERGQILLEPAALPPKEAWLWDNPDALAAVNTGLQQSAEGKTLSRGTFSKHVNTRTSKKKPSVKKH